MNAEQRTYLIQNVKSGLRADTLGLGPGREVFEGDVPDTHHVWILYHAYKPDE